MALKHSKRKKILSIVLIIILVCAAGIVYGVKNSNKKDENALVEAYVGKAMFGSIVRVEFTQKGKEIYPNAEKYDIYYKGEIASTKGMIGETTTVVPKRKPGEKIKIRLLDKSDNEIDTIEVKLMKE